MFIVGSLGSIAVVLAVKYTISTTVNVYRAANIVTIIVLMLVCICKTMQSTNTARLNSEQKYDVI